MPPSTPNAVVGATPSRRIKVNAKVLRAGEFASAKERLYVLPLPHGLYLPPFGLSLGKFPPEPKNSRTRASTSRESRIISSPSGPPAPLVPHSAGSCLCPSRELLCASGSGVGWGGCSILCELGALSTCPRGSPAGSDLVPAGPPSSAESSPATRNSRRGLAPNRSSRISPRASLWRGVPASLREKTRSFGKEISKN